jgi:hypothetical protein
MAKAKKANARAARPAKKAAPPPRKAAKKPLPKAKKKAVPAKAVRKPQRKPAPAPAPAPRRRAQKPSATPVATAAKTTPTPVTAAIAPSPAPTPAIANTPAPPASAPPELKLAIPVDAIPADVVPEADLNAARKKGVRKATITSGLQDSGGARRLGRSRIPVDAPLDVVFQNDTQAREAFSFLGIHSIRELEAFTADDLVLRLTGPAKLTVGRIRKILAMNNRCLTGDEEFAVDFQEMHTKVRPE